MLKFFPLKKAGTVFPTKRARGKKAQNVLLGVAILWSKELKCHSEGSSGRGI